MNRVQILRSSIWAGNGFGMRTIHRAILNGAVVGEWAKDNLPGNYAFDKRGAAVASYRDWKAMLLA